MSEMILDIGGGKRSFALSNGNTVLLDPNDMNVLARFNECMRDFEDLKEGHARLAKLAEERKGERAESDEDADRAVLEAGEALRDIDQKMRDRLNYLFDADVATPCAGNASMFDFIGGEYRFERIMKGLIAAYEDSIQREHAAMRKRIKGAKPEKYSNVRATS